MLNDRAFSDTIGMIYDCVPEPQRWPATLQALCDSFEAMGATLSMLDTDRHVARFVATCGDPAIIGPLVSTYAAMMPFYDIVHRLEIDVATDQKVLFGSYGPDAFEVFHASRFYREWYGPSGLASSLDLAVLKAPGRLGVLNIMMHLTRRPIAQDDIDQLTLIAPHIRRAVTIGNLFGEQQRDAALFRGVLDALAHPVLVVGEGLRVLYANPAAETFLRTESLARFAAGALVLTSPDASAALQRAVQGAQGDEAALGTAGIGIPLDLSSRPAVAHVLPLARRDRSMRVEDDAAAAIFIAATGTAHLSAIDAVASLFALTGAERRVAGRVADGLTRSEIAAAHGVTAGTVKSQLALIFDKTGTHDQRELQLLIRELTPGIRPI